MGTVKSNGVEIYSFAEQPLRVYWPYPEDDCNVVEQQLGDAFYVNSEKPPPQLRYVGPPPPPPRDENEERLGCGPELAALVFAAVVITLLTLTGCSSPQVDAEQARRTGVGILAESAIAKPRIYAPIRTPPLPTFAEPYATPNGDASQAFPAPALESTEQPATRETLNAGPCQGDLCQPQPARRGLFRRWR